MPGQRLPLHAPERRMIAGRGTDERTWSAFDTIDRLAACDIAPWATTFRRIWLLAPHPDDEVLGFGGSLARLSSFGADIRVVAVTDGEASHRGSSTWTSERLVATRPAEMQRGLERLGITADVVRLGLPDGQVTANRDRLIETLLPQVAANDLLLSTCRFDGHPDHEACGHAAAAIAARTGATAYEYPVWMWHWASPHEPLIPWERARRIALDETTIEHKREAIGEFQSQLEPDGAQPAVLPPYVLPRFMRPFEVVFV